MKDMARKICNSKKSSFPTTPSIKPKLAKKREHRPQRLAALAVGDNDNYIYEHGVVHEDIRLQSSRVATRRAANKHVSYVEDSGKKQLLVFLISYSNNNILLSDSEVVVVDRKPAQRQTV